MNLDVFVYIAGPITPKNGYLAEENVLEGLRARIALVKAGIPNYCPQYDGMFPSSWTEVPYEAWIEHDTAVINRCSHMLMLPRWEESSGATTERELAKKRGIPVAYSVAELVLMLEK